MKGGEKQEVDKYEVMKKERRRNMKILTIIALIGIFAVPVIAEQPMPHPPGAQDNPWFNDPVRNLPNAEDVDQVPTGIATKIEGIIDFAAIAPPSGDIYEGEDQPGPPGPNNPLWNWDVLIMSHGNPSFGKVSTDYDELTGDIYVSLLVPHVGADDSVYIYVSTDDGQTWAHWFSYTTNSTLGNIIDQQTLCGHDGGGTWVYGFVLYDASDTGAGLWAVRMRPDSSSQTWTQVVQSGDTLSNLCADRNVENPQHIFLGWSTTSDGIDMESSSDYTLSWGNHRNVSSNSKDVSVCAGGDGYVYITFVMFDTADIWIGRYTNNLIAPSFNFEIVDSGGEGDWTPSVAAARTSPGASQTAWCLYKHNHGTSRDIHYARTTDGGENWSFSVWPPINIAHDTWEMKYPYARCSYTGVSDPVRAVATVPEVGNDSLVYAWATPGDPTNWLGKGVYNDHNITGEFGGVVDYSSDGLGGYIVYRQYGSPNIWFDSYDNTSVEEENPVNIPSNRITLTPNPSKGAVKIYYGVNREGRIRISMYDASGRMVNTILDTYKKTGRHETSIDFKHLAAGIYFVKVETPEHTYTTPITIVK